MARTRSALREARHALEGTVGLVPTLGALHGGHAALLDAARARCDAVVATLFVNPRQFESAASVAGYPHNEATDLEIFEAAGVDVAYLPTADEMYPNGFAASVQVGPLGEVLEGADRPGHFDGVATVVTKLFHSTQPHRAYFGQKDWQQTRVIQRLVDDLNFEIALTIVPTVRDADGLALSSRNGQLGPEDRAAATALWHGLQAAASAWEQGERAPACLEQLLLAPIESDGRIRPGYGAVRDALTLEPVSEARPPVIFLVAAQVGGVRLIDNVVIGDGMLDISTERPS